MIGDNYQLKPEYFQTAEELYKAILAYPIPSLSKLVIGIAGESGSGKTISSLGLKKVFESKGKRATVAHMDDFFHLPPATNHQARLEDISRVGVSEVNLALLENVINAFRLNSPSVSQPLVNYESNSISTITWNANDFDVLIVEGTYTLFLENVDVRIFIDRDFTETKEDRMARGRDIANEFVEEVLAIEHDIIQQQKSHCDLCIQSNFTISKPIQA